ncbi:MAG: metallophosphoesterase [Bacteroidales bacterium]|jgi:hypothetical protein|nr:metallophosphoesterase [Bacteroidales bacterium]
MKKVVFTTLFALATTALTAIAQVATWVINPAAATVTRVGAGENVLKLENLVFDSDNLPTAGGVLDISYLSTQTVGSTRHIHVWTDLSGTPEEVEEYDFVNIENYNAGKCVHTQSNLVATDKGASISIPQKLLYDAATNTYASILYVSITTYTDADKMCLIGNQRGWSDNLENTGNKKEFSKLDRIELTVPELPQFVSHITITPGEMAGKLNFAWTTAPGTSTAAILQLNPNTPQMQEFVGENSAAALGLSSNKAIATGLANNTTYTYRVGDGSDEHWSKIYSFKTYDPAAKYSAIAVGDPQISSASDKSAWMRTVAAAVAHSESLGSGPVFMLSAGDQTDYANDVSELEAYLAPPALRKLPVAVTIGNHDVIEMRPGTEAVGLMDKIYNFPNHSDLKNTGADADRISAGGDYYFHYGNTLYISLNSQVTDTTYHSAFMRKAIASFPNAEWRVAVFHHNIYGGGSHASPKGYSDSYNMQAKWSPFLDTYNIDVAINGHDHVYARSQFMKNNEIQKYQMPTVVDIRENNLSKANPGTYIQPKGVQYMALSGASAKFYALEKQPWIAYGETQDFKAQYSIITIDGGSLTFATYHAEDDELIDQITLKKTADDADLQSVISGMLQVEKNNCTEESWSAFQQAIADAQASPANAHNAYVALYDAYYALNPNTDKTALGNLISTVKEKLATSSEGRWAGQYEFGSKAKVRAVFDVADTVYNVRLSTQENIDAALSDLTTIYNWFLSTESTTPVPFIYTHAIPANAPYTIDLVDWKRAENTFFYGADDKEHYDAHFTKQVYAKDIENAMRSDHRFGPANEEGGRGHNHAHITKTHIGEWVRYELNVEQAGAYKASLGAMNNSAQSQKVVLRDMKQNILTTFTIFNIPAQPDANEDWASAGNFEGDQEFYLPAGNVIVELFFVNNGMGVDGSATEDKYPAGPDVDILTLTRTGDMDEPVVELNPTIHPLPFIPTTTAGAVNRQRGWSTTGFVCPESGFIGKDLPVTTFASATHLVMELAGPPSTSTSRTIQVNILTESLNWSQAEPTLHGADGVFKSDVGPFGALVIDFENLVFTQGANAYTALQNTTTRGRILIGYFSYGWEELNVMKAYLKIKPETTPAPTLQAAEQLYAWGSNGLLNIAGLNVGEAIAIYNACGTLVHYGIATGERMSLPLKPATVYIVKSGVRSAKAVL